MRILWVVTKPPWPPRDGGRLLMLNTLSALAAEGHQVDLVSPCADRSEDAAEIDAALRPFCDPHLVHALSLRSVRALLGTWRDGVPVSVGRHASRRTRRCDGGGPG